MNRDFVEMLSALCDAEAEFLIVGAHAMAVHGRPRAIWISGSGPLLKEVVQQDKPRAGTLLGLGSVVAGHQEPPA